MQKNFNDEINNFFMHSCYSKIRNHVKLMISLNEMEELKKFQSSTFDTIAWRKLIEARYKKCKMIYMSDSKEFQDAELIRSGNSHVTSQSVSFPSHPIPGGMLSRSIGMPSRREGPPSIRVTHGISGNVFVNPDASSVRRVWTWKITCATLPRWASTPTTSPSPWQVMSPTTRSSTSSSTPRVPSPTLHRHRTWT